MKRISYILLVTLCMILVMQPVSGQGMAALEGYDVGVTGSLGFINGAFMTNAPVGASVVIGTPFGYNVQGFDLTFSAAIGGYSAESGDGNTYAPIVLGVGANATIKEMVFAETHLGLVGAGFGFRGFAGVSLERLMKKSMNLPVNILIGGEGFLALKPNADSDNSTYWGGLGIRIDYSL
ncbi:MAG: hypothetical protein HQ509_12070 [Candidatus Marinimicrobia bacterium]|nr:hypothetical protein [Candidatus Neomarinimicrobiota bacterium]